MSGVCILGATGTIGVNTLDVIARHPDRFEVVALGARRQVALLAEQCERFRPRYAALSEPEAALELGRELKRRGVATEVLAGDAALSQLAALPEVDHVMAGIVGAAGLGSTLAAARAGKRLMIANKEALIMAGPLVLQAARQGGATILPIDSEHNALFQCMPPDLRIGEAAAGVRRVLLTASGGPFIDWSREALAAATPAQACAHPKWVMGRKISVDSATLMNKGLEVIEASLLFGLPVQAVDVVVHRESIVHSLVEYLDGSVLAQLGCPDMRTPIAQALAWPQRMASGVEFLDLVRVGQLRFEPPDEGRFRCLSLAREAGRRGGLAPTVLNAANEVAVAAFLDGQVNFLDIAEVIESVMQTDFGPHIGGLDDVLEADARARSLAQSHIASLRGGRAS